MKAFDWQFPYPSQRMPVLARNVVATSQPLAAQAGLGMMQKGGNAVDAAVATNAVLAVVHPHMCGLGGDAFFLADVQQVPRVGAAASADDQHHVHLLGQLAGGSLLA